jgi:hypothetical protein
MKKGRPKPANDDDNPSSSSSSSKSELFASKLDSTSLLNANFVPEKYSRINEALATPIYANAPSSLQVDGNIFPVPQQFVSIPDSELCPVRPFSNEDSLYYAIEQRHLKLVGKTDVELPSLPQVGSTTDLRDFCSIYETLLTTERQELALLLRTILAVRSPRFTAGKNERS